MVSARASIAVTAVVPSRMARPASVLRRRCRLKLSISNRKNIAPALSFEDRNQRLEVCCLNDYLATAYRRLQRDWIAAALLAHGRCVERGGAHLAGDSLAADVEAYGAP